MSCLAEAGKDRDLGKEELGCSAIYFEIRFLIRCPSPQNIGIVAPKRDYDTERVNMGSSRHDLDDGSLSKYLADTNCIPGIKLPVRTTKIGYGQSNPSYFVDDAAYEQYTMMAIIYLY
jgi:hypothetical protein